MDKKQYDKYISYWNDKYFNDKVDPVKYKKKIRDIEIAYLKSQYSGEEIDKDTYISKKEGIELDFIEYLFLNREISRQEYDALKSTLYYREYPEDTIFKEGDIVSGRYKIQRELGEGGMATVYLALDNLDRNVVIKKIKPHLLKDDILIERFIREAHAQAKLKHPNIALVLDFDKSSLSLIQDYIEGEDLENLLKSRELSEKEALNIFKAILRGLDYAHENNIIHRDIKPSNILMDNFYNPKITDFGIAKIIGEDSGTQSGVSMGTPAYMSPEQIQGDKQIDIRTDIYSCGIMLYKMLTGILPFVGTDYTLKSMHLNNMPEKPSNINNNIPESLSDIVMKSISKQPSDRYADCNEFLNAIEEYEASMMSPYIYPEPEENYIESRKIPKRNPLILPIIIIILFLSSLLIYRIWFLDQDTVTTSDTFREDVHDRRITDNKESKLEDVEKLEREAWQAALEKNTIFAYEEYRANYPEGIYINEVEIHISNIRAEIELEHAEREDRAWEIARDANTMESLREYIVVYPDGRFINIANSMIEDLMEQEEEDRAFSLAQSQNTISSYKEYLSSYPSGRHSIEARSRISDLRKPPDLGSNITPLTYTNTIGMEFILVSAGSFIMGSPDNCEISGDLEKPQHRVSISRPYYIGKYPVTQRHWESIMNNNPSHFSGDNNPVENVSWNDAQEFISKLNKLEGHNRYRLPTEAEWEYAARGGNRSKNFKYSGSNNIDDVGWYWDNSGETSQRGFIIRETVMENHRTHEVGLKISNELGIYDMTGNVNEWCKDHCCREYNTGSVIDPEGPAYHSHRVVRGGSWNSPDKYCRVSFRLGYAPSYSSSYIGFRIVIDQD